MLVASFRTIKFSDANQIIILRLYRISYSTDGVHSGLHFSSFNSDVQTVCVSLSMHVHLIFHFNLEIHIAYELLQNHDGV